MSRTLQITFAVMLISSFRILSCGAQIESENRVLANQSGLSEKDIQSIRTELKIFPDPPLARRRIASVDANSLKSHGHVLVVEIQIKGCLVVHVMKRNAEEFVEVWSLDKLPENGPFATGSAGICSKASRMPQAHGTQDGKIVIEVPVLTDPFQRKIPNEIYSFDWDGQTYRQEE
jgi:hypothetical protein